MPVGSVGDVISKVSGETVISKISGEKVYAENQSGQALWVIQSGLIEALSGLSVVLESGTTVNLQSGETITAEVSGQKVYVENQSGQALYTQISGITVPISGETVVAKISGEKVYVENQSGQGLLVLQSGNLVVLQSGAVTVLQSGAITVLQSGPLVVKISGEKVYTEVQSGQALFTQISGYPVTVLQSGAVTVLQSGAVTVLQSGVLVVDNSGVWVEAHILSGSITTTSGQGVLISGQTVDIGTPTSVLIQKVTIGSISGGIQLTSGITVSATVKAASWNSGDIYLGGSNLAAGYRPYSGVGMQLDASEALSADIDNFNRMYAFASWSGDQVLVIGVAK